jgi:DNA-binding beta-propeller fold protein YncE
VVADTQNHRLALWNVRDGTVLRYIGSKGTNPGQFVKPTAVTVVPTETMGNAEPWLVVADSGNHRVQILTRTGTVVRELVGNDDIKLGSYLYGVTVCIKTGEVLVTDTDNNRVLSWRLSDKEDNNLRVVCSDEQESGKLNRPFGIVASSDGFMWVSDDTTNVKKFKLSENKPAEYISSIGDPS